jgi:tryptophan synthase alpha chain
MEEKKNSRISRVFESPPLGGFRGQRRGVLNVYCTAGYPQLDSTIEVMKALQENGADMIELGMPYSDPLADGPVIQASNAKALQNGMTIPKLFDQLKGFRNKPSLGGLGVILMGYMNPVLQYGFEKFCAMAAGLGVDGLILPDLPEYEFETEYGAIIKKHGLDFIFLVTPETSEERIKKLDKLSSGFLYAVSSSSTTGSDHNMTLVNDYLQRLQKMDLENPVLVGFGIKDRDSFEMACKYANGAIIGSAYIRAIGEVRDVNAATKSFLSSILPARVPD